MEKQFVKSCVEYGFKNGGRNHADAFQIGRNKIAEDMGSDLGVTRGSRVIARWFVEGKISKGDALELFNRLVISSGASFLFCFTDEKYMPELRQQNTTKYWRKVLSEVELNHVQAN